MASQVCSHLARPRGIEEVSQLIGLLLVIELINAMDTIADTSVLLQHCYQPPLLQSKMGLTLYVSCFARQEKLYVLQIAL
jgi:hypothetical protein